MPTKKKIVSSQLDTKSKVKFPKSIFLAFSIETGQVVDGNVKESELKKEWPDTRYVIDGPYIRAERVRH